MSRSTKKTPEYDKKPTEGRPLTQKLSCISSLKHSLPKGSTMNKPNSDGGPAI
jgi:hypothetical protein